MKSTNKTLALSIIVTAALAACGGGGGGDTTPLSTIVTSVPAATYAAGSDERAAYDLLNAERQKCGFGLLAQSTKLDAAAAAHSNYQVVNNVGGHAETQGLAGFTGANPGARAIFQGYENNNVGEDIAFERSGLESMKVLFSGPYHLSSLVDIFVQVGISYKATSLSQLVRNALTVDNGRPGSKAEQLPVAGSVLTYPCDGATDIKPTFSNESPNWASTTGIGAGGTPIVLTAPNQEALVITSASYTPLAGGVVPVQILTSANDPHKLLRPSQVLIIPPSSLVSNSSYRVQISGTVAGVAFSKDFTFKTGA